MSDLDVAIAVPARNEVERLPRLLRSLASQQDAPAFTLALLFDNCDDGSEALVAAVAADLPFRIVTDSCRAGGAPNAGRARRRAMSLASGIAPEGVLLTTDADSEPAPDWVATNLQALKLADVVAGRIDRELGCGSTVQTRLENYYDRLHALRRTLDPVPYEAARTHHWTSGASLAVRHSAYRAIGGFPASANGEDAAFADAAARAGYRVRRDASVRVTTSARRTGRADNGFAANLSAWEAAGAPPMVAHPADEAWRFALQAKARHLHGTAALHDLVAPLRLPFSEIEQVAGECRNGEAFAARIVGAPPGGMRMAALSRAEQLLASYGEEQLKGAA